MEKRATKVVVGSVIMVAVSIGAFSVLSVYLYPISLLLEVPVGRIVVMFSIASVMSMITGFILGPLFNKIGPRITIAVSGILEFLFFFTIFLCKNLTLIYAGSILYGFASITVGFAGAQILISWWKPDGGSKAMSLLSVGMGIFVFVLSPAITKLIECIGVQNAALVHGIFNMVVIIACAVFLISDNPLKYGYDTKKEGVQTTRELDGASIKEVVASPIFWIVICCVFVANLFTQGFSTNASVIYQSMGMDAMQASWCISIRSVSAIVWALLYGSISDKINGGIGTLVLGLASAVGFLIAFFAKGFIGGLLVAFVIGATTFAGSMAAFNLPRIFGRKAAGNYLGYASAVSSLGVIVGPMIIGFVFDQTGNYGLFLILAACLNVLLSVVVAASVQKSLKKGKEE